MEIESTLTGTEENVDQFSGMYASERGPEQARENNIILKAITLNSPQFRHESIALTLTGGKREKEKGEKKHTMTSVPMSDRQLIFAPGRNLQTQL